MAKEIQVPVEEKKPLRNVGPPVYAKTKALTKFKKEVKDKIKNEHEHLERKLEQFEQAQQRSEKETRKSIHANRCVLIILIVLSLVLVAAVVCLIITTAGLSAQLAQKKANAAMAVAAETTASSQVVTEHNLSLDVYQDNDLILPEAGNYTISGKTNHTLTFTADDDVNVTLAGVQIDTSAATALSLTTDHSLILNIASNTTNIFNATGIKTGTIYSAGGIQTLGDGILITNSTQQFGSGLTTGQQYFLDGGKVIILGSDMIQRPWSSAQPTLVFDLDKNVKAGADIQIKNTGGSVIYSFTATQNFRNFIFSDSSLKTGDYSLFVDGTKLTTVATRN